MGERWLDVIMCIVTLSYASWMLMITIDLFWNSNQNQGDASNSHLKTACLVLNLTIFRQKSLSCIDGIYSSRHYLTCYQEQFLVAYVIHDGRRMTSVINNTNQRKQWPFEIGTSHLCYYDRYRVSSVKWTVDDDDNQSTPMTQTFNQLILMVVFYFLLLTILLSVGSIIRRLFRCIRGSFSPTYAVYRL